MVATMLLGGGIADRYRRDTVLRLTSIGAGLTQAGVAVLLLTQQHPALLLPLSALNGIFQGLTKPALRGILSNLVVGRGLQQASSLLASAGNTARILGPTVAGLLTLLGRRRLGTRIAETGQWRLRRLTGRRVSGTAEVGVVRGGVGEVEGLEEGAAERERHRAGAGLRGGDGVAGDRERVRAGGLGDEATGP